MNVVIYIRVSTKKQSVKAQKKICQEYATKCKYNVIKIIEETCSAYNGTCKQKKLMELIDDIKHHNVMINKIIVSMYDRFSRNINFAINALSILRDNNVALECVIGNIPNTNTPLGMKLILYAFIDAQYESALIGERVRIMNEYNKTKNTHSKDSTSGESLLDELSESNNGELNDKHAHQISIREHIYDFIKFARNTKDIRGYKLLERINKLKKINVAKHNANNLLVFDENNNLEKWKSFNSIPIENNIIYNSITYYDISSLLNRYGILNSNGNKWTVQEILRISKEKEATKKRKIDETSVNNKKQKTK